MKKMTLMNIHLSEKTKQLGRFMDTETTGFQLYGFLIGKDIHIDIDSKQLYRISSNGSEKNLTFGTVFFSDTMLHLLIYMLTHGCNQYVTKDELLEKIWEENKLSPSPQRLWQVLTSLNKKLQTLGLPPDFIKTVRGCGHTIEFTEIKPLYSNSDWLFLINTKEKNPIFNT